MPGHVIHLAVVSFSQPFGELAFRIRKVDIRDTDLLKAEFSTPTEDVALERRQVNGRLFR